MMTDAERMKIIERRFIKFLLLTIRGLKLDYYNKQARRHQKEILADPSDHLLLETIDNRASGEIDDTVKEALSLLSQREQTILYLTVVCDLTEITVARHLDSSQQYVNKTKNKALSRLRESIIREAIHK